MCFIGVQDTVLTYTPSHSRGKISRFHKAHKPFTGGSHSQNTNPVKLEGRSELTIRTCTDHMHWCVTFTGWAGLTSYDPLPRTAPRPADCDSLRSARRGVHMSRHSFCSSSCQMQLNMDKCSVAGRSHAVPPHGTMRCQ